MVDAARSAIMRSVRRANTGPELDVRKILHRLGLRFRLHYKDLPGKPDIVLPRFNTVVFVHGCFWHRHHGCPRATSPKTRQEFWGEKFERNMERDQTVKRDLRLLGWRVLTVWECETRKAEKLSKRLGRLFRRSTDVS
jgi:DNA mismatch endonuclease (patch repair protein)